MKIIPYDKEQTPVFRKRYQKKAGVFIYDKKKDKVLLVQSRGHLWGHPKGSINIGERERDCAVREVREETGIQINYEDFTGRTKILNRCIYFYLEMDECDINVQEKRFNDANGISWINTECLEELILNGDIVLNKHSKLAFRIFLKKVFNPPTAIEL